MRDRTKSCKAIKIYHDKHNSFKQLLEKDFFNFFNLERKKYNSPLVDVLIAFVKEFNPYDSFDKEGIAELLEEHFDSAEVNFEVSIPEMVKEEICNLLHNIYVQGATSFNHFRGEVVEYLLMYLEKDNAHNIYHEPRFYHKKRKLFKTGFVGSACLIDIVKVNKRTRDIDLIECKANLDVNFKLMTKSFKNKLSLMDALKLRLETYVNPDGNLISVQKSLATINTPIRTLPPKYTEYQIINLFDHFMKTVS